MAPMDSMQEKIDTMDCEGNSTDYTIGKGSEMIDVLVLGSCSPLSGRKNTEECTNVNSQLIHAKTELQNNNEEQPMPHDNVGDEVKTTLSVNSSCDSSDWSESFRSNSDSDEEEREDSDVSGASGYSINGGDPDCHPDTADMEYPSWPLAADLAFPSCRPESMNSNEEISQGVFPIGEDELVFDNDSLKVGHSNRSLHESDPPENITHATEEWEERSAKVLDEEKEKGNTNVEWNQKRWQKDKAKVFRNMFSREALDQHNEKQIARLQGLSKKKSSFSLTNVKSLTTKSTSALSLLPTVMSLSYDVDHVGRAAITIQKYYRGHMARTSYKTVVRRGFVVRELLDTEQSYVKLLRILNQWYIKPLTTAAKQSHEYIVPVISMHHIDVIFSRASAIYDIHIDMLNQMQDRFDHWHKEKPLGDLFLNMTSTHMDVYTEYVNNYGYSIEVLQTLRQQAPFKRFLDERREYHGIREDLSALLIAPVQRIPRYSMLLEQILRFTPKSHTDFGNLQKALRNIKELANEINERRRAKMMVDELANKMTGSYESIATLSRYMVLASDMIEVSKAKLRRVFLMNDIVVSTTPFTPWSFLGTKGKDHRKINYQYRFDCPLHEFELSIADTTSDCIRVQAISEANANYLYPVEMKVTGPTRVHVYLFLMKNDIERAMWLDRVNRLKGEGTSRSLTIKGTFRRRSNLRNSLEEKIDLNDQVAEVKKTIQVETNILNSLLNIRKIHENNIDAKERSVKKQLKEIDENISMGTLRLENLHKKLHTLEGSSTDNSP